jgi:hypothetical protein
VEKLLGTFFIRKFQSLNRIWRITYPSDSEGIVDWRNDAE